MYFYESHSGGIFFKKEPLEYEELYCDMCGDADLYLGFADTPDRLMVLIDSYGLYYSKQYMEAVICEAFGEDANDKEN